MSRILPLVKDHVLKVIDTIDVFSTKREKVLRFGIDDLHVDEREETRRLAHADLVLAIQEEERLHLQRLLPDQRVITAGVDVDVVSDAGVPVGRRVLCVASANPMNRKGIADFLRFAWPQIRREVPDAELRLVGDIGEAIADTPGVIRLGRIADLAPEYRAARAVINPAVAGTGLKIKTLEALGHLRRIVTWPAGTDGVAPELAAFCDITHDWYEFARRVSQLLIAPEPKLFSTAERDTIVRLMSPDHVYAALADALDAWVAERAGGDRSRLPS
jgi:glycosyltransferase involved in cell wall biosynthesis